MQLIEAHDLIDLRRYRMCADVLVVRLHQSRNRFIFHIDFDSYRRRCPNSDTGGGSCTPCLLPPSIPLTLQALPPPRPISIIAPVSALTLALKAKSKAPKNPFDRFATLSAKADPNPLYIKIYIPSSSNPSKPLEML